MLAERALGVTMKNLDIAAVIPLYNGGEFIEEALNSVLIQTLPPSKIIVVDDGSTDSGPDMVESMARDHNICLLRKPNGGQASARNLGIARAQTPLIALLLIVMGVVRILALVPFFRPAIIGGFTALTNTIMLHWVAEIRVYLLDYTRSSAVRQRFEREVDTFLRDKLCERIIVIEQRQKISGGHAPRLI